MDVAKKTWCQAPVRITNHGLFIAEEPVMQRWETPLMHRLAQIVTRNRGHVLEVGFGLGISAEAIIQLGCKSYTVIEAHPKIANRARIWARGKAADVKIIQGFWQDTLKHLDRRFDGILFDTYPIRMSERGKNYYAFLDRAPRLLTPNGCLTYYSGETVRFRNAHLRLILKNFTRVALERFPVTPPSNCAYWKEDHMMVPMLQR